jgi:hypothetical protein
LAFRAAEGGALRHHYPSVPLWAKQGFHADKKGDARGTRRYASDVEGLCVRTFGFRGARSWPVLLDTKGSFSTQISQISQNKPKNRIYGASRGRFHHMREAPKNLPYLSFILRNL